MCGQSWRLRMAVMVLTVAAIGPLGPAGAAQPPPEPEPPAIQGGVVLDEDLEARPAVVQRPIRPDRSPPPSPLPLPTPPAGLDLRPPSLGPGGLYLPRDAADPDMLVVGGTYFLFSTNTSVANAPVWVSTDLTTWQYRGDALPDLPDWANPASGTTWAPSVHRVGPTYNLYFSGLNLATDRFCIGVATAKTPEGPFRPRTRPLVCQPHRGGSIDPYLFTDDRSARYLIYKTDTPCCELSTELWSQRLTGDGLRLAGRPSQLLFAGAEWEAGLIEGPTMVERAGRFHLFYSGNWWHTHFYAIGHAVCESVNGPCHRSSEAPFIANRSDGVGFGGPSVWEARSGEVWMVYHGWYGPGVGYENGGVRAAFAHRLDFPDWAPPPVCFGVAATLIGTNGDDVIKGTRGRDVIVARGGDDTINGGGGEDLICGGSGRDTIRGGRGRDDIRGQRGRDTINADGGKDVVDGGPGNDTLRGGPGNDRVWGAGNVDTCWGERMRCEVKHRTRHDA